MHLLGPHSDPTLFSELPGVPAGLLCFPAVSAANGMLVSAAGSDLPRQMSSVQEKSTAKQTTASAVTPANSFSSLYSGIQADFPLTLMNVQHVHVRLHCQDIHPFLRLAPLDDVQSL